MYKLSLLFVTITIVASSCCLFKDCPREERPGPAQIQTTWHDTPQSNTTQIRVVTNLMQDDLRDHFIKKLMQGGGKIDVSGSSRSRLKTQFKYFENYYVQFFVSVSDSVAIISGRWGNRGINAIAKGEEASEDNIDWEEIKLGGRGWERMNSIASPRENWRREYSSVE